MSQNLVTTTTCDKSTTDKITYHHVAELLVSPHYLVEGFWPTLFDTGGCELHPNVYCEESKHVTGLYNKTRIKRTLTSNIISSYQDTLSNNIIIM